MAEKPARGTAITLHLREGQDDLLAGYKLRSIIRKYSDHIVAADPDAEGGVEGRQAGKASRGRNGQPGLGVVGARRRRTSPTSSTRSSTSTSATISRIRWHGRHARVEGRQEFTHLLYVPARAPFDLWDRDARHGIKLYVRRVFIMDDAEQLHAGVSALRPRRRRFERPAAQRVARDPAGIEGHRGDPRRLHAESARPAGGASRRTTRRSTRNSGAPSARC